MKSEATGGAPYSEGAELSQAAFAHAPDAIVITDDEGRCVEANPAACELLGYAREELLLRPITSLLAAEFAQEALSFWAAFRETGRQTKDIVLQRKDGRNIDVRCSSVANILPGRHVSSISDISERKQAERALREKEERLLAALTASAAGTFRWDIKTNQVQFDEALEQLWGLRHGEQIRCVDDLVRRVHPDDRAAFTAALRGSSETGRDFDLEYRIVYPDASVRWVVDKGKTFFDSEGRPSYMTGACLDITQRKRDEEALKEADRRKNEFIAMLAHELRNPLAPARSVTDMLRVQDADRATTQWGITVIDRQIRHLSRIVDDLLDLSRIARDHLTVEQNVLDLREVVSTAVDNVRVDAKTGELDLQMTLPSQPVDVRGDAARLTQVLDNLLDNAVKYTRPGGRIRVSLETEDGEAVLRVTDTGLGIGAELLQRVFELFEQGEQTLARSQGGLGLGLPLVQRLVALHGGSVHAYSAGTDCGSEFTVRLPLAGAADRARIEQAQEQRAAAKSRRVLVVDDNDDVTTSLTMLLKTLGHEVESAADGPQALAAAERFAPEIVLLDIGLPGMDGYEVARRLRARYPHLYLVAVTGYGREEDRARSREAGFDEHLTKPTDLASLERVLSQPVRTPAAH